MKKHLKILALMIAPLLLLSCDEGTNNQPLPAVHSLTKRQKIEQKIILDLRYFCDEEMEADRCRTPFTHMNPAVEKLLAHHSLAGIILFAGNIESIEQTVTLTHELQQAAWKHPARIPLLITIDQEGGKVTRLPQAWSSGMAGNMAIGAVPAALQRDIARDVGQIIGGELSVLGINTNHAPVLDVNVNAQNPVINVRAFSDDPHVVARLGVSFAEGLLSAGVAPTIKHFPGHGDTHVDSHIGLPLVEHDRATVEAVDILPFRRLIEAGKAPLVMTAHIQYPALDDSLMTAKDGNSIIVPATFSRKIISGLLRHEFKYDGVILSDALDMHAITKIVKPAEAVVATFAAGVDLAQMPYAIRSMEDVERFAAFIDTIEALVEQGQELDASVARILSLKKSLNVSAAHDMSLERKIADAKSHFSRDGHRAVERRLAKKSITLLKASGGDIQFTGKRLLVVMPSKELALAFKASLSDRLGAEVTARAFFEITPASLPTLLDNADVVLAGNVTPPDYTVDLGTFVARLDPSEQKDKIHGLLGAIFTQASAKGRKTIFASLRFPTDAMALIDTVDAAYALYNFKTRPGPDGVPVSASFDAFADILAGESQAVGQLPMGLGGELTVGADRPGLLLRLTKGKRLGLMVNQSSLVSEGHLIDHMLVNKASIAKLFAVEHGVRGTADAGEVVTDGRDSVTGLAITSLYGTKKQPTVDDLRNVDMLVFDIQDVGVRFFTFLSSLHYFMEGCAATNTPLIVLDRPNPNGAFIDGPILKPEFKSFVGMHPIPVLHGMTLGELARMINGEGWLKGGGKCELTVVPIKNYSHSARYDLPVRPSPNLPNSQAVRLYPSLALFEATDVSVGRGTPFPFQVLGGVKQGLGDFSFTPVSTPGAAKFPKHMDVKLYGDDMRHSKVEGLDLAPIIAWHGKMQAEGLPLVTRPNWLAKLSGSNRLGEQIAAGMSANEIKASWQDELDAFKLKRAKYLLYPE